MARECPETELVAMADMEESQLAIARDKFSEATLYRSGEAMAREAEIDAVFVTTGDRFHAGNAREALTNGKHVLIEKPMAQSFEDLREIARLRRENDLIVGAFLELRHAGLWRRTREIIDSGEIGDVLSGALVDHVGRDHGQFFGRSKARTQAMMVSLVLQKGVHALDLLNWFLGASPWRVSATGALLFFGGDEPADKQCADCERREECPHKLSKSYGLPSLGIDVEHCDAFCVWSSICDMEDVSYVNLDYTNGAVATYNEVHFAPYYRTHFTLYGTKAQLEVEANHDTGEAWIQITERYTRNQRRERPTRDTGHGGADPALVADFARAAREGREPLSGLRAGFESAAIGIAARQSIDAGTFIEVPLVGDAE